MTVAADVERVVIERRSAQDGFSQVVGRDRFPGLSTDIDDLTETSFVEEVETFSGTGYGTSDC